MKEPCIDCSFVDNCDFRCSERTAWINYKKGIKEVVEWLGDEIWEHYTDPSGTYHWVTMKPIKLEELQSKLKGLGL